MLRSQLLLLAVLTTPALADEGTCSEKTAVTCPAEAEVVSLFEAMLDGTCQSEASPAERLGKLCYKNKGSFERVAELMRERFPVADARQREIMVGFLAWEPWDARAKVAAEFLEADPQSFSDRHLLAFAEGGQKTFAKPLMKRVWEAKEAGNELDVRVAAYLAMEGKDLGRETLVRTLKRSKGQVGSPNQLLAAVALEQLGETEPYARVREAMLDGAVAALDRGDLAGARALALRAEFVEKSRRKGYFRLAWFEEAMQGHCAEREAQLASADEVFELLENVIVL